MEFILIWILLIPLAGALVGWCLRGDKAPRAWALFVSLVSVFSGIILTGCFDFNKSGQEQFFISPSAMRLSDIGFQFSLGVDAISFWLIALTIFLMPLVILASWESITRRSKEYYAWMLMLQFAMLGVFVARDLLLFYAFFELTLIPMFFIIGIWGGSERQFAAIKFFLFTFSASVLTFAGVVYLATRQGFSFDMGHVIRVANGLDPSVRLWVFLAMLAGFAVKVPLFPMHTWLPLAHTEAPTAGSVILAGVLLKLGTYGLLRIAIPVGGAALIGKTTLWLGGLCLVGIIYGALVAWVQKDIKKLVAYSSVSHLGFCVLGLLAMNPAGIQGSVLYMINHGLSTGALFLVVGMIYDRYHTRDIRQLSGLARRMPRLAFFFILFTLSSIGLPGLNGFVSEFLTILGAFTSDRLGIVYGVIASLGIILGAVYMLHMAACVLFGPLKEPHTDEHGHDSVVKDIGRREVGLLLPLAAAVIALGVVPNIVLDSLQAPTDYYLMLMSRQQVSQMTMLEGSVDSSGLPVTTGSAQTQTWIEKR